MMANFTTLKEAIKSIQELKLTMRIYSHWSGITNVTRVSHKGILNDYSCVIYTMEGEHKHNSQAETLLHGNSESDWPYIKTKKAVLKDLINV